MREKKEYTIEERIVRYFDNSMSESELNNFMRLLDDNEEYRTLFKEYLEILEKAEKTEAFFKADAKQDWKSVLIRMNATDNLTDNKGLISRSKGMILKVAALVLILISTGILLSRFVFSEPEIILVSCMNDRRNIILPDGSSVFLNNYSSLEYPEKFKGDMRLVTLKGEAYFEIENDPAKLFRVDAGGSYVDVMGTMFNINIDNDLKSVKLGVVSGTVAFYPVNNEEQKVIMLKDEQAVLKDGEIRRSVSPDNNYLSWKSNILVFQNDKIDKVAVDLSRHYDKSITIHNISNQNLTLTTRFENQDMDSILEELRLVLGVNYSVNGDSISIYID